VVRSAVNPMLPYHSALRAFVVLATHHQKSVPQDALSLCEESDPEGSLLKLLRHVDLDARAVRFDSVTELRRLGEAFPLLLRKKNGCWWIVIGLAGAAVSANGAFVLDIENETAGVVEVDFTAIQEDWGGLGILCGPRRSVFGPEAPFGFQWFLGEILKYRTHFRDIALAALVGSVLSFVTPLLFSILVDRVIPHRTYQTLGVVVVIFVLTALFESLFGYLRQNLTLITTNRIDATLSSKVFEKLLTLPMSFFDTVPAGVVFRYLQQTSQVRHFLTGRLFVMLLDMISMPILIVLLVSYSWQLAAVVVAFALMIAGVISVLLPLFQVRLNELYTAEGNRQAHSIETLHGIRTVKSLCLEPAKRTAWEEKVVASVRKAGGVAQFGIMGSTITSFLEKAMQLSVLSFGAMLVFDDKITLGALIAFNMLSNRVSGPLIQIVGLINEYQETALSVRMLGNVMNHPPERDPEFRGTKPVVSGRLDFDRVSFVYPGAARPALDRVEFTVEEGEVIGVVGRSGSGKTTLTRLIQGIQIPTEGIIKLDGVDLRQIDLAHLRRNIGIVLQESFLFRGTIRENIAVSNPHARTEEIVAAARLAGAEEFIDQLPMAYDSMLEEGATNLSGGQRQRIAIARALLPQPRLLIFDEATSALDPESEAIIQQNLADIAKGRSMIIVSHRLSSLVNSDRIMVLDKGAIADFAPHSVLLERCEIYTRLWEQQTRDITK
jgi:subfamily B ATP-binding cassette protein HlyB/CyaB